ncbi:MAG TPA: VWA domain-containing protein, partial [Bacteroidota bacterium]
MKFTHVLAAMVVSLFLVTVCTAAGELFPRRTIGLDARLNSPYISSNGGTAYLHISVTTPDVGTAKRRPMNISVVLDRSGSMAGEGKIDYAKRALNSLIDQLNPEDIFSIVVYDDQIDVLRAAAPVRDKWELKRLVESIYARGSTNLGGGMIEGFQQVQRYVSKEFVNRVVLLSDGLANQGIVDPTELNRIARQYRSKSITLTTMGVGLDYNENLMVALADNGGGNYYFIESPNILASILRKEMNMLASIVAQNAVLEMTLGKGVHLKDIIGCEYRPENALY